MKMKLFRQFLRNKIARGEHYFLKKEAMSSISLSSAQFNVIASRLGKERLICSLSHGFFLIISDARSLIGFPYVAQFLNEYMKCINVKYYVSLLSGAEKYGSLHQSPQIYQVITEKHVKDLVFGKGTILFHSLSRFAYSSYTKQDSNIGILNIASLEQVCIDLITFYKECGYWNNVCTIITELIMRCEGEKLKLLIKYVKTVDLQRLGYIFEFIAKKKIIGGSQRDKKKAALELTKIVKQELGNRRVVYAPLSPPDPLRGRKNMKWKLIINYVMEPDL